MLLTPHILVGVAIATKVPNPALGLVLALLSHYFLDSFPQREYSIKNIKEKRWNKSFSEFLNVFLDISFGILLVLIFLKASFLIFAAAFLAILPDGFTLLGLLLPKNKLLQMHYTLHQKINNISRRKEKSLFWGIFSQLLVISIAIFFLLQ